MKVADVRAIIDSNPTLFGYGATMHEDEFCKLFLVDKTSDADLEAMAKDGSFSALKKAFDKDALAELGAVDVVKNQLHQTGKHIRKDGNMYRICLPSENESIAASYRLRAKRAERKAKLLTSNTPVSTSQASCVRPF